MVIKKFKFVCPLLYKSLTIYLYRNMKYMNYNKILCVINQNQNKQYITHFHKLEGSSHLTWGVNFVHNSSSTELIAGGVTIHW